jgi:hypothetical protein
VRLRLRPVGRARWTGRVVTPEGHAVPGAIVMVRDVATKLPANAELCQMTVDARAETALDGTFSIELPPGKATLVVHHPWYLQHEIPIAVPSPPRKIVMNRGVRWTGRLLDPDGAPIEHCHISVRLPVGGLVTSACGPSGFTLRPVPPGATLHAAVQVTEPPLGQRAMRHAMMIGTNDHVADIRWPPGDTIAGVVSDSKGNPKPGALLMVIPNNSGAEHDPAVFDAVVIEADANGAFAFRHLKPGMWKLRGDRLASEQAALVVSTGTTDVRFVVPK